MVVMENCISIIRPFAILQISRIEKWLEKQAVDGYKLIHMRGWRFTFVESAKKERKFFVYKSPLFLKHDKFITEYYIAKQRFGLRKTALNKATCDVFEIDQEKMSDYFHFYFISRTKHYLQYYRITFLIGLFYLLFFVILALTKNYVFIWGSLIFVLPVIYSLLSVITLSRELQRHSTGDGSVC